MFGRFRLFCVVGVAVVLGTDAQQRQQTAEDIFQEVWNDIGLQDYLDTLQRDVQNAFGDAVDNGNWGSVWDLAKRRKGAYNYVPY